MRYKKTTEDCAVWPDSLWEPSSDKPPSDDGSASDMAAVYSEHGIAIIGRWRYAGDSCALIRFVWGGRDHQRTIEPAPSRAGGVRMAREFVREVVGQEGG